MISDKLKDSIKDVIDVLTNAVTAGNHNLSIKELKDLEAEVTMANDYIETITDAASAASSTLDTISTFLHQAKTRISELED